MRVFITNHNSRGGGGVSVASNLLSSFMRVAPNNEYFVTIPPGLGYEQCLEGASRCQWLAYEHRGYYRLSGQLKRWLWETHTLPLIVERFRPDVIFNMANRGFLNPAAPQATFIQDAHLFYPFAQFGNITLKQRFMFHYHRAHLRKSLRHTGLLFCQTAVAADRLRAFYRIRVPVELCPTQHCGNSISLSTVGEVPASLKGLHGKFKLIVVAYYYPHKNLEIIPRVFERYRESLKNVVVILTICPEESGQAGSLLAGVRARGLEDCIVNVGPIPREELPSYYAHVDGVLLPTLLESFSGTYLEAMTYGRPILTSDLDFARGVCGDAARYFKPLDPQSVFEAIVDVAESEQLRKCLVDAGKAVLARAESSWDAVAARIVARLEQLAGTR